MNKLLCVLLALTLASAPALAQEKATPSDVYVMVVSAVDSMQNLGVKATLSEINKPDGAFVQKDTYVFVYDCDKELSVAHPNPKFQDMSLSALKDGDEDQQRAYNVVKKLCAARTPQGAWVAYDWPGPDGKLVKKISLIIEVPDTPYQVLAGIYDEEDQYDVDELNSTLY